MPYPVAGSAPPLLTAGKPLALERAASCRPPPSWYLVVTTLCRKSPQHCVRHKIGTRDPVALHTQLPGKFRGPPPLPQGLWRPGKPFASASDATGKERGLSFCLFAGGAGLCFSALKPRAAVASTHSVCQPGPQAPGGLAVGSTGLGGVGTRDETPPLCGLSSPPGQSPQGPLPPALRTQTLADDSGKSVLPVCLSAPENTRTSTD